MRLGLIADTHGRLPPQVAAVFAGVDQILHAGDVGGLRVIAELERLAPVTVVQGNTDVYPWPEEELVELDGLRLWMRHIVDPWAFDPALRRDLGRWRPDLVVFGHTHQPADLVREGVRFINPGSPTKPRGDSPPSVAVLELG
ncbi:MAG: metallophosphoesterase, partial [Verrucomicrobia bacterium]